MILIVDDDVELLKCNVRGLEQAGFECVSEPYPATALIRIREGLVPELVITDYNMAGMNGVQLATEIRKILPDVPILFHSGEYALGMDKITNSGFRMKGCRISDLVDDIKWMLGQEK
jgi:two-component system chemotaxis response regulator CheY